MTTVGDCRIPCPACGDTVEAHGTVTLADPNPDTHTVNAVFRLDGTPWRTHITTAHADMLGTRGG